MHVVSVIELSGKSTQVTPG